MYRLRRALDAAGPHGVSLVKRPTGYMLDAQPDVVDVWRFRDLAARGVATLEEGDAATALTHLRSALALWRGPALADVREAAFAPVAAERLEDERLTAAETLTDEYFVLADRRTFARDSRAYGGIPRNSIRSIVKRVISAGDRDAARQSWLP